QAALTAELPLDALHAPGIGLVIVPQEVKEAVQSEHAPLEMLGMAGLARLPARNAACNRDFARIPGKRQHICRVIDAAEASVERLNFPVADECDVHRAARAGGRDAAEPGRESAGGQAPAAS